MAITLGSIAILVFGVFHKIGSFSWAGILLGFVGLTMIVKTNRYEGLENKTYLIHTVATRKRTP